MPKCGECARAAWVSKQVLNRHGEYVRVWKVRCPGSIHLLSPTRRACQELFRPSRQLSLFGGAQDS